MTKVTLLDRNGKRIPMYKRPAVTKKKKARIVKRIRKKVETGIITFSLYYLASLLNSTFNEKDPKD